MKLLGGLPLLCLLVPLACSSTEDGPPNPLSSRIGFCESWAKAACNADVVMNCNAASTEDCVSTQSEFCLDITPDTYASKNAKACIDAVKLAYKDAVLNAEELQIVLNQADPCDQLAKGTTAAGDACSLSSDCDTVAGYSCVLKVGAADGTCEIPVEVEPGGSCDDPDQVCTEGRYCNGENCIVFSEEGEVCTGDFECAPEQRCSAADAASEFTCTPRAELNEPCTNDTDCASAYCAPVVGQTEGECASNIVLARSEPLCVALK